MRVPRPPRIDERRSTNFSAELYERARAWIPTWDVAEEGADFGRALLDVAARFSSEVAERLDVAGDKMQRGFLDWLAVRGEAARPARLPVVLKLTDAARDAVLAEAPVRLQAAAGDASVIFETETDVRVVPGSLDVVVGVDGALDAFYLPPPGLNDLTPLDPAPSEWQTKAFAAAGAEKLQLDPEQGLAIDMIVEADGERHRLAAVDKDLVTIAPPLASALERGAAVKKVSSFTPFDGKWINRQQHALYIGHPDVLNVEAAATIEITGAGQLQSGVSWQYWGKVDGGQESDWQALTPLPATPQTGDAVVLSKDKGSIDPKEMAPGVSARWVRALRTTSVGRIELSDLEIRINCQTSPAPCPPTGADNAPDAEAMANTTPIVLDGVFFPLGKEPRQFDAFYLGCDEAFSKKDANVQLCFEMADPSFSVVSSVASGPFAGTVLAGVAKDRALHLMSFDPASGAIGKFRDREPLQPPTPGFDGAAAAGTSVALDQQPLWRLPAWSQTTPDSGFLVGVAAGDAVWVWHEHADDGNRDKSGWIDFGAIPVTNPPATDPMAGLVYLDDAVQPQLVALRNHQLATRVWPSGAQWDVKPTLDAGNPIELEAIVPLLEETASGTLVTSVARGLIGVSKRVSSATGGDLYSVTAAGVCTKITGAADQDDIDISIRPVAVRRLSGAVVIAAVQTSLRDLVVNNSALGVTSSFTLPEADAKTRGFDVALQPTGSGTVDLYVLTSVAAGGSGYLAWWTPPAAALDPISIGTSFLPSGDAVAGAPTKVGGEIVIPGELAQLFVGSFDLSNRHTGTATIESGIVVPASLPAFAVNDLVVRSDGNVPAAPDARFITQAGRTQNGEVFYPIDSALAAGDTGPLMVYGLAAPLAGTFALPDQLTLDPVDHDTQPGPTSWLVIGIDFYSVDALTAARVATISRVDGAAIALAAGATPYVRPLATGGRTAPFMQLDPTSSGNWDASLLARLPLAFPAEHPAVQQGKAFQVALGNKPVIVVLSDEFVTAPAVPAAFVLDATTGTWQQQMGDSSSNPELSWEYWNGKGWWHLDVSVDETRNLKRSGAVRFTAPADLISSDWAGKTNRWIRARLVGGDYGKETVTVTTKDLGGGVTEQTVNRSSEGIRAPSVVALHISYRVCTAVAPTYVRVEDSGSTRDESDANRTGGAIVEAFVPVSVMLGRLSDSEPVVTVPEPCPPECGCPGGQTLTPASIPGQSPAGAAPVDAAPATGRAIFLGLAASVSGAPVNVLLLVEERNHTAFAPMTIEALGADGFAPLVVDDATRALGESGVLSMAFAVPPVKRDLFGSELAWLRLTPKGTDTSTWNPTIRGAYLNAVWASATETLTRELLGSSEGAPNLTVALARPPLLRNTLALRVREPLGDEERTSLRAKSTDSVLSNPDGLDGDWVLWTPVVDPLDSDPGDRVYAIDEGSGQIRFGDGLHGRIPPIGVDSIVAFSYQRTEAGKPGDTTVPGNTIAPRTTLNLVSPVDGVQSVAAADQAAGGAPAESDDRVLRFGFARERHRGRAVTAHDLEDLALESSPDIVQARAITTASTVKLVVVMRGNNPVPLAAQARELQRLLLAAAPVSLSAQNLFHIEGPKIRVLRIELRVRVETLARAGAVGKAAKDRLVQLFDAATGGTRRDGWALGLNPTDRDIAFALVDAPDLESIEDVQLYERLADGSDRAWPGTLKANELVMLAEDPIRIQFETAEALV